MAASSKGELVEYLEESTTCPLCYERYREPRSLPCLHTICTPCLETHVAKTLNNGKYGCPICRREIALPVDGVKGFPVAFLHVGLAESLEKVSPLPDPAGMLCQPCKLQGNEVKAVGTCPTCMVALCAQCKQSHDHLISDLSSHDESPDENLHRSETTITCEEHLQELDHCCETCVVEICSDCLSEKHHDHECMELEKAARKHKSPL